jgi:hypothetical protein
MDIVAGVAVAAVSNMIRYQLIVIVSSNRPLQN